MTNKKTKSKATAIVKNKIDKSKSNFLLEKTGSKIQTNNLQISNFSTPVSVETLPPRWPGAAIEPQKVQSLEDPIVKVEINKTLIAYTGSREENEKKDVTQKNKWVNTYQTSFKSLIDLVKYPVITEKTYMALYKNRQYTFDVDKRLTKTQIKKLFETLFNVIVISVNTHIPPRRKLRVGMSLGSRPSFKRAIITLKEGCVLNYSFKTENLTRI
ncbi:MAG: 50S ribosomal protein L23 [Agrobacterium sp.]|uniref:Large ribosomal subunit protein uL23c n=1 Tax=Haematococcus lacustris TaxID=44745 RepID=A0A0S2IDW3_HAELA|nr:50S ribosomal protein L23 [Haematococcus lacustris]ALO21575.1 ribosomal protein L23 [Haematococcus lacustris]AUW36553.1 50S ribosomal protein L23 [Haematococcus lacustris]